MDLLDWQPPEQLVVGRYPENLVRSQSLRDRISLAVAETLKSCDRDREDLAAEMSAWLGEEVSRNMLDAYASQGRADHTISFLRLLALVHVTDDLRLLQLGAELFGHSVVDDKFLPWVEVGQLAAGREEIGKAFDSALRQARKGAGR
ncbi:S46 family peptidase [Tistlia consotensis]|nr:S46 family peptidase [Tistlia consotensis]